MDDDSARMDELVSTEAASEAAGDESSEHDARHAIDAAHPMVAMHERILFNLITIKTKHFLIK